MIPEGKIGEKDRKSEEYYFAALQREFKDQMTYRLPRLDQIQTFDYGKRTRIYIASFVSADLGKGMVTVNKDVKDVRLIPLDTLVKHDFTSPEFSSHSARSLRQMVSRGMFTHYLTFLPPLTFQPRHSPSPPPRPVQRLLIIPPIKNLTLLLNHPIALPP